MADRRCYEDSSFDPEGDYPVSLKSEKLLLDDLNVKLLRLLREDPRILTQETQQRPVKVLPQQFFGLKGHGVISLRIEGGILIAPSIRHVPGQCDRRLSR